MWQLAQFLGTVLALTGSAKEQDQRCRSRLIQNSGQLLSIIAKASPHPWQDSRAKLTKTKRLAIVLYVREVFALDEKYLTFQPPNALRN